LAVAFDGRGNASARGCGCTEFRCARTRAPASPVLARHPATRRAQTRACR